MTDYELSPQLNTVPLIIGLLASLWLAAIAASVIAVKQQPFSLAMDTLGILDVMWLLYRNHWDSDGWNISPTTHELRRIGQDMKLHSNLTQAQMQDQMKSSSRQVLVYLSVRCSLLLTGPQKFFILKRRLPVYI